MPRPEKPNGATISVYGATWAELAAAGRVDTTLGQTALAVASRIDNGQLDTGSSIASLAGRLQQVMAEALKDVPLADDPVDELQERRKKRQASA